MIKVDTPVMGSVSSLGKLLVSASVLAFAVLGVSPAAAEEQEPVETQAQEAPGDQNPPRSGASAPVATEGTGEEDEAIVVTGLRASVASAQSIRQNADQFVDSITAIDIGKLPDVNVAEALQRVPGIQITRNRGEGSSIAIRGLTEVRTEVNGRDAFSGSGGRGLGFEDVPSELLAGVDVYKNPSAELIEGGIGGVVNLRTRMPFDQRSALLAATFGVNYYENSDKLRANGSLLFSNRWKTGIGEIGLLLHYSQFEGSYRSDESTIEPYFNFDLVPGSTVPAAVGAGRLLPDGGGIGLSLGERFRQGLYGAIQWRPSSELEFYAQGFRTRYETTEERYSSFITCFSDNGTNPDGYSNESCLRGLSPAGPFTFDDDGSFVSGGFSGFNTVANNGQFIRANSLTTDLSAGVNWQASDRLRLNADVQYVRATYTNGNYTTFAQRDGPATAFFDVSGSYPRINFGPTAGVEDPSQYYLIALMDHSEDSDASQLAARSDLEWDFDEGAFLRSFTAGVRYTDRAANNRSTPYAWTFLSAPWAGNAIYLNSDPGFVVTNPSANDFFGGPASNSIGNVPFFNGNLLRYPGFWFQNLQERSRPNCCGPANRPLTPFTDTDINLQDEQTYAGYAMLRFGADLGGMELDGNIGVRVTHTQNQASGQNRLTYRASTSGNASSITVDQELVAENSYTDVQPSLNLRLRLQPELQLRFAAARALSRPNFQDQRAILSLSENYTSPTPTPQNPLPDFTLRDRTGSGGNPYLKPQISDQVDLALEWYPRRTSMLFGTVFYKWLSDIIQTDLFPYEATVPGSGIQTFNVTGPVNFGKGYIRGVEVGARTFFEFLPGALASFGGEANFTYVDSKVPSPFARDENNQPIQTTKEGLSKYSYNLVGFFERWGLTARVAYNWRSESLRTASGNGTGFLPIYRRPYGQVDASLSYDISRNIGISAFVVNALRESSSEYQVDETRFRLDQRDDRRFGLTIRVRN